jgi:hypothetical protein
LDVVEFGEALAGAAAIRSANRVRIATFIGVSLQGARRDLGAHADPAVADALFLDYHEESGPS